MSNAIVAKISFWHRKKPPVSSLLKQEQSRLAADAIAAIVVLLMTIGTVFVFSASTNIGQEINFQKFYDYPGLRQIIFFPLACLIMYIFSRINFRRYSMDRGWYKNPVVYLLLISIALLSLILVQRFFEIFPKDGFIPYRNKHYRWLQIPLGSFTISFQPSELAKWMTVFLIASLFDKFGDEIKLFWKRFVPICLIVGLIIGLIIVEDFGTAALIALISFLMMIISGVKLWHILPPLPPACFAFYYAIVSSPTRINRLTAFRHLDKWQDTLNYQPNQSLIAIGSGGLLGKGLGQGISKYGHLPEDHTDFIFSIIGEELGFAGNATVIMLFIAFIILGIFIIVRCRDPFGRLLASGIILTIAIQAAINIGVVTVVLPTKGIPLPFVSSGGTSMLLTAAAIGVLINIAKNSQSLPRPQKDLSE
ncbi:MAG: FtsW/RodA/SpoVE family cell cycle protein [Sedimentisphaerales bacterium]|nr:FtsW/RodA/SpoVE family cell cycle protein [Sedimentisphaerales bacterium]